MTSNFLNFIVLDESNDPVLNEQGLPQLLPRPDTKSVEDIERLISLNKPVEVINKFAELVCLGEQWNWAQSYYDYLVELNQVTEFNANLPEPVANEDGTLIEVEPKAIPTEPERPVLKTVEQVLEPYAKTLFKLRRQQQADSAIITVSTGKSFDADEVSIARMANAIIKHWQIDPDDTLLWSTADVDTGVMVDITKSELVEAHNLATEAFAAAWAIDE